VASVGVPEHDGATANSTGAGGRSAAGDLQHIWPVQSLLWVQLFGHVAWQYPSQQSSVFCVPLQSDDVVHAFGHG